MAAGGGLGRGGFDCELAEKPPEKIDIKCPICLLILREPQQMKCGKIVCKSCIIDVLAACVAPTCPFCRRPRPDYWPDVNRKQILCGMRVYCRNSNRGCEWQGELGDLDNHLNENPSPKKAFKGCNYTTLKCKFCKKLFPRNNINTHQQKECSKRPYTCQYCGHKATYTEIKENHLPSECPKMPIPCPHCHVKYQRQHLDNHVVKFCELVRVPCKFHIVGCKEELLRKDMAPHLKEANGSHVAMLNECLKDCPNPSKQRQSLIVTCLELLYSDVQQLRHDVKLHSNVEELLRDDYLHNLKLLLKLFEQSKCKLEQLRGDMEQLRDDERYNVCKLHNMEQAQIQTNKQIGELRRFIKYGIIVVAVLLVIIFGF